MESRGCCRLTVRLSHYLTLLSVLCPLEKILDTIIDPTPAQSYLPAVGTERRYLSTDHCEGSKPSRVGGGDRRRERLERDERREERRES